MNALKEKKSHIIMPYNLLDNLENSVYNLYGVNKFDLDINLFNDFKTTMKIAWKKGLRFQAKFHYNYLLWLLKFA